MGGEGGFPSHACHMFLKGVTLNWQKWVFFRIEQFFTIFFKPRVFTCKNRNLLLVYIVIT